MKSDWLLFLDSINSIFWVYKYRCVRNACHSVLGYLSRMPKNEAAGPSRKRKRETRRDRDGSPKAKRRLFRRRVKNVISRVYKHGAGFIHLDQRRFTKGLQAHIVGPIIEQDIDNDITKNHLLAMYDGGIIAASYRAMDQINSYAYLFDQYRVDRMLVEFWLEDTDEFTKPDTQCCVISWAYDPDAMSKVMTEVGIDCQPDVRREIMMPGKVYNCEFKPKFVINNKNDEPMFSWSKWMDLSSLHNTNQSGNGVQFYWTGKAEPQAINFRFHYIFSFRGRRQNAKYQTIETSNTVGQKADL